LQEDGDFELSSTNKLEGAPFLAAFEKSRKPPRSILTPALEGSSSMARKSFQHGGSLGSTLVGYAAYSRKTLPQFHQQKSGPSVLRRENNHSEKNEQYALQEWQNQSDDSQQDETPARDEQQNSLDVKLHDNKCL
jgi:hypothetical protein